MLARSRALELAGVVVESPLLVPSMSSKALGPIELRNNRTRQMVPASRVHSDAFVAGIDEALLISAYDLHYGYLDDSQCFSAGFNQSAYADISLLIIDSGWYEKNTGPTGGIWYYDVGPPQTFTEDDFGAVIDGLDGDLRADVVSWDHSGAYGEQISSAQQFFGVTCRERHSSTILLKPDGAKAHHDFAGLSRATAADLRAFNVVGVTEKELGESITKRLCAVAQLRALLDDANVEAPIHVFGGLDPLMTPLYFAAGAEIFDGLSWLRYAFSDGAAISRESLPLLDGHFDKKISRSVADVQLHNLDEIRDLSRELKVFVHYDLDWSRLRHSDQLRAAYDAMESARGGSHGR